MSQQSINVFISYSYLQCNKTTTKQTNKQWSIKVSHWTKCKCSSDSPQNSCFPVAGVSCHRAMSTLQCFEPCMRNGHWLVCPLGAQILSHRCTPGWLGIHVSAVCSVFFCWAQLVTSAPVGNFGCPRTEILPFLDDTLPVGTFRTGHLLPPFPPLPSAADQWTVIPHLDVAAGQSSHVLLQSPLACCTHDRYDGRKFGIWTAPVFGVAADQWCHQGIRAHPARQPEHIAASRSALRLPDEL